MKTMTMKSHSNPREQAEAVARWCGWKRRDGDAHLPWRNPNGMPVYRIPDYAEDLNAMDGVERMFEIRGLLSRYREVLESAWLADDMDMDRSEYLIRLTAAQCLQAAFEVIQREVESVG